MPFRRKLPSNIGQLSVLQGMVNGDPESVFHIGSQLRIVFGLAGDLPEILAIEPKTGPHKVAGNVTNHSSIGGIHLVYVVRCSVGIP